MSSASRHRSTRRVTTLAGWLTACVLGALPGAVRANDFDQFQNARVAYESQNHEIAADLFQGLLSDASERDSRPLVLESRKYLAATYLFLGRPAEAEVQIAQLLRADPDYVLDPLAFPADFVELFAAVQARIAAERARDLEERARRDAAERREAERRTEQERERLQRLVQLASTERVEQVRSRWIALLPFGIGQFQNGHDDLGLFFAITEGTLLAAGLVSFALHENLRDQNPDADQLNDAELAEASFRYANQISLGLFAAVALTGIVEAQIRFKPSHSFDRPRPLPPDLQELQVSVGLGGFSLQGRF